MTPSAPPNASGAPTVGTAPIGTSTAPLRTVRAADPPMSSDRIRALTATGAVRVVAPAVWTLSLTVLVTGSRDVTSEAVSGRSPPAAVYVTNVSAVNPDEATAYGRMLTRGVPAAPPPPTRVGGELKNRFARPVPAVVPTRSPNKVSVPPGMRPRFAWVVNVKVRPGPANRLTR